MRLSPLGTPATSQPVVPAPHSEDDRWMWISRMRTGRGNRSIYRKPASVPLCSRQMSYDLTWDWSRAPTVRNRWLTAWVMARPATLEYSLLSSLIKQPFLRRSLPYKIPPDYIRLSLWISQQFVFTEQGRHPCVQPPTCEARAVLRMMMMIFERFMEWVVQCT